MEDPPISKQNVARVVVAPRRRGRRAKRVSGVPVEEPDDNEAGAEPHFLRRFRFEILCNIDVKLLAQNIAANKNKKGGKRKNDPFGADGNGEAPAASLVSQVLVYCGKDFKDVIATWIRKKRGVLVLDDYPTYCRMTYGRDEIWVGKGAVLLAAFARASKGSVGTSDRLYLDARQLAGSLDPEGGGHVNVKAQALEQFGRSCEAFVLFTPAIAATEKDARLSVDFSDVKKRQWKKLWKKAGRSSLVGCKTMAKVVVIVVTICFIFVVLFGSNGSRP